MRRSHDYIPIQERPACIDDGGTEESYTSDSESCTDSYSDGSEVANWEKFVSEDGSLFYVEYIPKELCSKSGEGKIEFIRDSSLRVAKKSSRRQQNVKTKEVNEIKKELLFSNISTAEESSKSLELVITAADRFRFGRRSTAVESILGFNVVPFVDQPECLMVDGFVHDMPALFQQGKHIPIGRGDWFKTLDDIEIRTSNIDELLLQFIEPTKVCLKFQEPIKTESSEVNGVGGDSGSDMKKIENYAQFAQMFDKLQNVSDNATTSAESSIMTFGFLILPPECYQDDEHKNSLYHYPEDPNSNFLYKARGSFLTLNAVLSEELKTKPSASKLAFENVEYFVYYRSMNGFLVLYSFPCSMVTLSEGNLRADELLTYIKLMFPNMSLDSFKKTNFRQFMCNFCEVQRVRMLTKRNKLCGSPLEDILKESRHLPLPKEAQLRIFDALSEMEAMDYRNWNDEPLHTHREFFIYGSVLYYNHFMLASQMPLDMRHYIEVYMRCRGVFDFVSKHHTKELYVWEEIVLPDTAGRYFLAVCGRGHLILTVILKIFCTPDLDVVEDQRVVPSLFYIEEIQETLDHLVQCGIESLAMFWSISNKRPETLETIMINNDEQLEAARESKKVDTSIVKQKHLTTAPMASGSKEATSCISTYTQRSISYDDDTQLCSSLGGSSVHSLTPSEDDSSKKRLITQNTNVDESDSGSDWENFADENLLHCGTDAQLQPQVTESLWKEISNVVPVKISAGWKNHIFHYIYVDSTNSSVFCPLKSGKDTFAFAHEMYEAFHLIHNVLQKTKNFKRDVSRPTSGRELVPVKEHGMTIRVSDANDSKSSYFVAVGRLFVSPPKEVYICHRPEISQNMVEMAFRLSFFALG